MREKKTIYRRSRRQKMSLTVEEIAKLTPRAMIAEHEKREKEA